MPAAAAIPAPLVHIKTVAFEKFVFRIWVTKMYPNTFCTTQSETLGNDRMFRYKKRTPKNSVAKGMGENIEKTFARMIKLPRDKSSNKSLT